MGDPPPSIISTGAHFSSCNFILEISSRLRENWFVVGAIRKVMEVIYIPGIGPGMFCVIPGTELIDRRKSDV